jgi:hypothetical protein
VTQASQVIPDLENSGQPTVRQLQPSWRALVAISQVHCYQTINYTEVLQPKEHHLHGCSGIHIRIGERMSPPSQYKTY